MNFSMFGRSCRSKQGVFLAVFASLAVSAGSFSPLAPLSTNPHSRYVSTGLNGLSAARRGRTICQASEENTKEKIEVKTWNPLRLLVLKLGMTEPMYSSPLNYEKKDGTYSCAYCGSILFDSKGKYDSASGWPSFWRSERDGAISYKRELDGRVEILCKKCNSHLGHVFPDGPLKSSHAEELSSIPESDPATPERLPRFCVNGASLKFNEEGQQKE